MKKVEVLLSCYNGSRFLKEQLDSLLGQEGVILNIIVRDDCSTDDTVRILNDYSSKGLLRWYTGENLKPLGSFMHLLLNCEGADYYAFCDQDDVWLPNKLSESVSLMEKDEIEYPDYPIIIHSDMTVVDYQLNVISKSFWDINGIRPDILNDFDHLACYNGVNGCTILMNNKARDLIKNKYFEQKQFIHDVFCALTVAANGGIIDYVDKPLMLYRQHEGNVVGADKITNFRYIKRFGKLFSILRQNYDNYKAVNLIKRISFFKYITLKVKYVFTPKHGIRK